jgi:Flp pilus assembly protein TadD
MQRTVCACLASVFSLICCVTSLAQDIDPKFKSADTNNAVIQGRVTLPSGFALERYARITLRNTQSILSTLYTNKSGEFQIRNLSEGVYYVQAETTDGVFEPVTRRVELGRGLMVDLNMELRERKAGHIVFASSRVVSAAELRQQVPSAAGKAYELGLKAVKKGDFVEAATYFEKAVTIYPEFLAARNDLGAQYLKLKRIDEAEQHFQMVLAKDPKNFNAKFNMGLVYVERQDYAGGINVLNQALSIDSTRSVAHLWIGIAKLEMGELEEAESSLVRSLLMGGNDCVAAHFYLARLYFSRGDLANATRSVKAYMDEAPRGEHVQEAKALADRIRNH